MLSAGNSIGTLLLVTVVLTVLTFLIAKGFRICYYLLGLYHPTEEDVIKYRPSDDVDDYLTENWFRKGGLTFVINFSSIMVTLLVVLVYGILFLDQTVSYRAIFGTGIVILGINTSLRFGSLFNTRWELPEADQDLLSFGHAFFTSLWVLAVLGLTITVLNKNTQQISRTLANIQPGSLEQGMLWGCGFIFAVIIIPFLFELIMSKWVPISKESMDFVETN